MAPAGDVIEVVGSGNGSVGGCERDIDNWVVVSNIFYFHPDPWGNDPI